MLVEDAKIAVGQPAGDLLPFKGVDQWAYQKGSRARLLAAGQADRQLPHRVAQRQVPGGVPDHPWLMSLDVARAKMEA